jgi:hypothetical protein
MRHVEILEDIAENSTNEGFRLTAIRVYLTVGIAGRAKQFEAPVPAAPFHDIAGRLV